MKQTQNKAILFAILAAALYSISAPLSKVLLGSLSPTFMAALLYLGAGIGVLGLMWFRNTRASQRNEERISRRDLPFVAAMIALDIAAPILLMVGLQKTSAASVSLLGNFEIVATALIALLFFKESITNRLWIGIAFITASCALLSMEPGITYTFSVGSLFVLGATVCWGLENNCTRMLSVRDPMQVVVLKGFGSGFGSLLIAASLGQVHGDFSSLIYALVLGFFAYGLSIYFYVSAQRHLGAARTSAFYAVAPFIGVIISFILFGVPPNSSFFIALPIMIAGTYFASTEGHVHPHSHLIVTHNHWHRHNDGHHNHSHEKAIWGWHKHVHTHEPLEHIHEHCLSHHHDTSVEV